MKQLLTTPEEIREYHTVAEVAVREYGIAASSLEFIGRSEVAVVRVNTETPPAYALRIHSGVGGYRPLAYEDPTAVESSLLWLEALAAETSITVQEPLRNRQGSLLTSMEGGDPGTAMQCSVVTWVEGDVLPAHTSATARGVGRLAARLHEHAAHWSRPVGFHRPAYDSHRFQQGFESLLAFEERELNGEETQILLAAGEVVVDTVAQLGMTSNEWGVFHGDLGHPGNVVTASDGVFCPIDFNGCSLGHYLCDIAWAFCYIPPQFRRDFLEGYAAEVSRDGPDRRLLEIYQVGVGALLFQGWMTNAPEQLQRLAQFVHKQCEPLLQQRSFLFGI